MKATFDGQDYTLMLDKETNEIHGLGYRKLEAPLTEHWGDRYLGKTVSLELADNDGMDGIELKYLPDGAGSWEAIQNVRVKIDDGAYSHIRERGQFGTKYNGSDKIEIINGDPRTDF